MKKIILASTSPRRHELMEELGLIFDAVAPDFDESLLDLEFSYDVIEDLAFNKAESVAKNINFPALVIGADTVVIFDNKILGKPKDSEDAFNILKKLQNNTHKVVTSISLIDTETGRKLTNSNTSFVSFNLLSDEQIKDYITHFEPFDKAGSYGIQEVPDYFVESIEGDFDNIMGLPTKTLIKMLADINK